MTKNKLAAAIAVGLIAVSSTAFAEDNLRPNNRIGQPKPFNQDSTSSTTPVQKPPFKIDDKMDEAKQKMAIDPAKLQACVDALKKAQTDVTSAQATDTQATNLAIRAQKMKVRQARFDIQQKFTLDMFNAETTFMNARDAAQDAKDKTAMKAAQDAYSKAKKDITQTRNTALAALEKDNKTLMTNLKPGSQTDWKEFMESKLKDLPQECRQAVPPPTANGTTTPGSVKGAFIKAFNTVKGQMHK